MAEKIRNTDRGLLRAAKRDTFFSRNPNLQTSKFLQECGFFVESCQSESDTSANWLITPLNKLVCNANKTVTEPLRKLAVLYTSGGFCPIHEGHLQLLGEARSCLEKSGYTVIGAYLAPDHDEYISQKVTQESLCAELRVRLCQEAVKNSDWIMVDPWPALSANCRLNLTTLYSRMELYLGTHIEQPISLFYVAGGDNAQLALSFIPRGNCVIVNRQGMEERFKQYSQDKRLAKQRDRIHFCEAEGIDISSSSIRKGERALGIDDARVLYESWRQRLSAYNSCLYVVRDENLLANRHWLANRSEEQLLAAWNIFTADTLETLSRAHAPGCADAEPLSAAAKATCVVVDVRIQIEQMRAHKGNRVISLDPFFHGDQTLSICRVYDFSASDSEPLHIARPGSLPMDIQLSAIPPGVYDLLDDDIFSGQTINAVRKMLPSSVQIDRELALTCDRRSQTDTVTTLITDVLDCRDFLPGTIYGGLVVRLPDATLARSPYALPYVWPNRRASVPALMNTWFSIRVWQNARRFFDSISPAIRLYEAWPDFQSLMKYLKHFGPETTMSEICSWHIAKLTGRRLNDVKPRSACSMTAYRFTCAC